jgi:Flp pilus assembly protein TadD
MPGKVTPAALSELGFADAEGLLIATGAGDFLVPPETRRAPADVSPFEFDDLAARAKNLPWLRCYAQTFGNNYFVDSGLLAAQAWRFFAQGASEIAVRLLERAVACGRNPDARHALEAQLQGMRIASHRFAEAGKARSPPGGATNVKNFLIKAKGWALVMSGDAASGRDFLRQARLLSEIAAPGSVEDLYLRNILALAEARTGDLGEALRLEQEITAANGRLEPFDWRLHYVNMVNTARLFRAAGRPTDARDAYVDAFATGSGNLSESDRVYDEACLARLAAETGCPARAMQHWFRASLAFAASAVPEALSARCAAMLLSRRTDPDQDVTEGVAEALYAALEGALAQLPPEHAWHVARLPDRGHSLDAPTFIYAGVAPPRSLAEAFGALGADGWSVIPVRSATPPAFGGASHRSLRLLLARLIEREAPQHARLGFATYVVDARQGRPIASSEREQIESCVSLRLNRSIFAGRRTELSPASLGKLEQASRLRLGDLVRHVEMAGHRARVVYKRYLPERCEDDEYGLIEAAVAGDISLGTLLGAAERDISREIRARARDLEDKRVICCDLPPSWRRSIDEDES